MALLIASGWLLTLASATVAVIGAVQGDWVIAIAMAVCAATVGTQVADL